MYMYMTGFPNEKNLKNYITNMNENVEDKSFSGTEDFLHGKQTVLSKTIKQKKS